MQEENFSWVTVVCLTPRTGLWNLVKDPESRAEERDMFVLLSVISHLRFLIIVLYMY